jgi:hypothetical protein
MPNTSRLVILYDARRNTYTVCDHNLTVGEADKQVRDWSAKLLNALVVDQQSKHRTSDPQLCRACRRDVGRVSGLTPKPRFQRRHHS